MLRLLSLLVTVPLTLAVISFALSNRQETAVGLWPLPSALEMPVWFLGLSALVVGFAAGGFVSWLGGHARRVRGHRLERRVRELERTLAETEARADAAEKRLAANRPADAPVPSAAPSAAADTGSSRSTAVAVR
ncbi:MAG TPA: lipopolysaccharide assembly protein LapA domain-containing protein [Azospirillaceae bacterium]|nr:lipopolysaccharide assembly protein LapA domain-containing protein [Azospirillaceae bacterium]